MSDYGAKTANVVGMTFIGIVMAVTLGWFIKQNVAGPATTRPSPASRVGETAAENPSGPPSPPARPSFTQFRHAVATVESNRRDSAVGQAGELGRYQVGWLAWADAMQYGKFDWPYSDSANRDKASYALLLYLWRWCPQAIAERDWETCARTWNGGPRGASKSATTAYWAKIEELME